MTLRSSSWGQAHPVTTFYLLAFAISWAGWLPALAAAWGVAGFRQPGWQVALLLPAAGPAMAAWLAARWQGGGERYTLSTLFRWRVPLRWYALAVALPLGIVGAAAVLSRWLPQAPSPAPLRGHDFALFLLLSLLANPWEEVGWRGFALGRLQARYPAAGATLIVGALWGLWHLPLFLLREGPMPMARLPVVPWFVALLGQSFVMTWLFNRAGRSLAVVALYHVATNGFSAFIGVSSYGALAAVKVALALGLWLLGNPGPTAPRAGSRAGKVGN